MKINNTITIILICFFTKVSFSQITTFTGSYGSFGSNWEQNDAQFSIECSNTFDVERLSSGMKWRYFLSGYSGLNVEGFGRIYLSKESKTYESNNKWYLQLKAGYGIVKPLEDTIMIKYSIKEKSNFLPLYGGGIGYKFLINEKIVFDFLLGYHYQGIPKFNSSYTDYNEFQQKKWAENLSYPVEFQWSIGFLID
jgi:hypothetical protein